MCRLMATRGVNLGIVALSSNKNVVTSDKVPINEKYTIVATDMHWFVTKRAG